MKHEIEYKDKIITLELENPHIETGMKNQGGFYEMDMLQYIEKNYSGFSFIDIGAYIGNHSIFVASFCNFHSVYAFEPVFTDTLIKNVHTNNLSEKITVVKCGILDNKAEKSFTDRSNGENPASTRLIDGKGILCYPLDFFRIPAVRLIKIDVEGVELQVLHGAKYTLAKYHPVILVEAVKTVELVDDFLGNLGYVRKARFNATPTYLYE